MNSVSRALACTPDQVFAVFADGWLYPTWVVGATRMRGVDDTWPAAGSKLHHSVGTWPAMLDDTTSVLEWSPPTHMTLEARAWPVGTAHVRLEVAAEGAGCTVTIHEDAIDGPGSLIPKAVRAAAIQIRNVETLKRLAYIAEGR